MKRFALLLSVDPLSQAASGADQLHAAINAIEDRAESDAPITWNLPARMITDPSSNSTGQSALRIKERGNEYGDAVLPIGLSGADPRLLTLDELRREREWAFSNRWMTGLLDAGFRSPSLIFAEGAGVHRPTGAQSKVDFAVVGVAASPDGMWLGVGDDRPEELCALIEVNRHSTGDPVGSRQITREVRRRLRRHVGRPPDLLTVRCLLGHGLEQVKELLEAAATLRRSGWDQVAMSRSDLAGGFEARWVEQTTAYSVPEWARAAARQRKGRRSLINTRRILETTAFGLTSGHDLTARRSPAATPREFVATMMGDAELVGDTHSARFTGGRFTGFLTPGTEVGAHAGAAGQLITMGEVQAWPDEPASCFSFESDECRGVRAETRIDGGGVSLSFESEYAFPNGIDALIFHITTRDRSAADGAEGVAEATELHLVTAPVDLSSLSLRGLYPDGSEVRVEQEESASVRSVCGSAVEVRSGTEVMTVVFVDRGGIPTIGAVSVIPEAAGEKGSRVALAGSVGLGRLAAAGWNEIDWSLFEVTGLLVPGGADDPIVTRALERKLPREVMRELSSTGSPAPVRPGA